MICKDEKYTYNDLFIVPAMVSNISHRSECNCFDRNGKLPFFASPMASVVNKDNINQWETNAITPIVPRTENFSTRITFSGKGKWVAWSLSEFVDLFVYGKQDMLPINECGETKALIDIANGHMIYALNSIEFAKSKAADKGYNLVVMYGNIANPLTYLEYARFGVDYIRCGIGSGDCCITSSNTGVHYPMASLIDECNQYKNSIYTINGDYYADYLNQRMPLKSIPKIVADGGIRNYSDTIKALALGADMVMVGTLFGSFFESASPFYLGEIEENDKDFDTKLTLRNYFNTIVDFNEKISMSENTKRKFIDMLPLSKTIFGMSTKKAQIAINGTATKTSEGVEKVVPIKYTIHQWTENMEHYLRTAMSYCNTATLEDFIGKQKLIKASVSSKMAINK